MKNGLKDLEAGQTAKNEAAKASLSDDLPHRGLSAPRATTAATPISRHETLALEGHQSPPMYRCLKSSKGRPITRLTSILALFVERRHVLRNNRRLR